MSIVRTTSQVPVYELDGTEPIPSEDLFLILESHCNYPDRVVLEFDAHGHKYTVIAADLIDAVRRCSA